MTCPFCTIDQEATRVIHESKHVVVVLSNPRLMPGHLVVVPRRHVLRPSELNDEERKELFDTVLEMQEIIIARFVPGCDIRQHYRPFIAQDAVKVDHVHFQLHPRELEDELYQRSQIHEKVLWQSLPEDERLQFTELFRHADL